MGGPRNLTPQGGQVWTHDFCQKRQLYVFRRAGQPDVSNDDITYLLLNGWSGGRVRITDPEDERKFLLFYARDLAEGRKDMSYVQKRTPNFRFFMDIDVRTTGVAATPEQLRNLVEIALGAVREFVPTRSKRADDLRAYVCSTLPGDGGGGLIKSGAHLHVPGLVVDAHTARMIRGLAVKRATEAFGQASPFSNSPNDIYDDVVYLANGIRMVGSVKYARCSECRRGDGECPECGGFGRKIDTATALDELTGEQVRRGRTYELTHSLRFSPEEDAHVDDPADLARLQRRTPDALVELVQTLSIRTNAEQPVDWVVCPSSAPMPQLAAPRGRNATSTPKVFSQFPEDVTGMNRQVSDFREVEHKETMGLLRRVLEEVIVPRDPRRAGIRLKRARVQSAGNFVLYVDGPGSTLCDNMPGDGMHRSNSIYFMVTPAGAEQRCFCTCTGVESKRSSRTLCKGFKGRHICLPDELRASLFPLVSITEHRQRVQAKHVATHVQEARDLHDLNVGPLVAPKRAAPGNAPAPKRAKTADRPPSVKTADHARQTAQYQYRLFSMAVQQALTQGPQAEKTRVERVSLA